MKITYSLILLFIPFSLSAQDSISKVTIEITQTIGIENAHSTLNDIFGKLGDYTVDGNGNIYIADRALQTIKKFNKEGKFLKKIGRRGRGPAEFLEVSTIFSDGQVLYAPDPMQYRISVFDFDGNLIKTLPTSKSSQDINFFKQVFPLKNGKFLSFYKQWGSGKYAKYNKDEIFHIWNSDFDKREYSFGSFDLFGFTEYFAIMRARSSGGSSILLNDNTILVSPHIYSGELFLYTNDNEEWAFKEKVNGYKPLGIKPYITLNSRNDKDTEMTRSFEGEFFGKINIKDAGIYSVLDKYIAHFLIIKRLKENDDYYYELGVEMYDIVDFELLGYYPLENYEKENITNHDRMVGFNKDDHFYMTSRINDADVLQVFKLKIDH